MLFSSALLSSCINDKYEGCPDISEGNTYRLNIDISAPASLTRAAGDPTDPGTNPENFINLDDVKVFVLNSDNNSILEELEIEDIQRTGLGHYTLTGTYTFPDVVHPFRLAVLANSAGDFQGDYSFIKPGETTLNGLYSNTPAFEFTMPVDTDEETHRAWSPVVKEDDSEAVVEKGIPMFGLSKPISPIPSSTSYIPPVDIEIPMLRSLAKLILNDKTPEEANIKIISAYIKGYNKLGRFIPDGINNPDWWKVDNQVLTPSLPSQISIEENAVMLQGSDKEFYAYLPEMEITDETERPVLEILASVNGREGKIFEVPIGEYPEHQLDEEIDFNILRNHRYTFNILNINDNGVTLIIRVNDDWEEIHSMGIEDITSEEDEI